MGRDRKYITLQQEELAGVAENCKTLIQYTLMLDKSTIKLGKVLRATRISGRHELADKLERQYKIMQRLAADLHELQSFFAERK